MYYTSGILLFDVKSSGVKKDVFLYVRLSTVRYRVASPPGVARAHRPLGSGEDQADNLNGKLY